MAFADPAVVTPTGGSAQSLVRITQDDTRSVYKKRETLGDWALSIRNTEYTKKNGKVTSRHNAELIHTLYPVAPSTLSTVRKGYLTFELEQGDTIADVVAEVGGLLTFMAASSNAKLLQMTNGES